MTTKIILLEIPRTSKLLFTNHFTQKMNEFGLTEMDVLLILAHCTHKNQSLNQVRKVNEFGRRCNVPSGQWRAIGSTADGKRRFCILIEPVELLDNDGEKTGRFNKIKLVTTYEDSVVTKVRKDQLKTEKGKRFAKNGRDTHKIERFRSRKPRKK